MKDKFVRNIKIRPTLELSNTKKSADIATCTDYDACLELILHWMFINKFVASVSLWRELPAILRVALMNLWQLLHEVNWKTSYPNRIFIHSCMR